MYRVALVCEGPADRAILEAILFYHLGDFGSVAVQPPLGSIGGDAGPLGGGWKGVRLWCQQETAGGRWEALLNNFDLLVLQVDADISLESELGHHPVPCPPPEDVVRAVRNLVFSWLGKTQMPPKALLCIPAMASETWALVALFHDDPSVVSCDGSDATAECVECRTDIKAILRRLASDFNPKLVVGQAGALKNQAKGFRDQKDNITANWPRVLAACGQAREFDAKLTLIGLAPP